MLKRRYSVILTALLLLSMLLTACQGSDTGGSSSNSGTSSDNGQSTAPTAAATSEAAGLSGSGAATATTGDTGTGNSGAADNGAMVEKLDFGGFGGASNPQVNYNPFSPNALTSDYTFEPLYIFNTYSCDGVPWLATKYEWTDPQTLVYTIRDGVKWNDGQPFSADDVVFTYNLLQKNKAFDTNGIWETIDNVSSSGNQFTVKFKAPSSNMLQKVS